MTDPRSAPRPHASRPAAATPARPGHPAAPAADSVQAAELPLVGLKVVELHAIGPVPFAGRLLQALGAEVLRVSPPSDPGLGVSMKPEHDLLNAGKTVLHLDLKRPEGLEALHARLAEADVLLEGFRPGVLERLGLAPESVLARHPRLVIGRLSGWGSAGPLAARAGHDINYLALAGVLHAIGTPDRPIVPLNLVADFGGGAMHLLVGVLARLARRGIDGRGGTVQTSILAGTIGLTSMFYGLLAGAAWNLVRENNLLDGGRPFYRAYRCADDRFVAVGAIEPKFWRELLRLLELEAEIDPADQYREASWPATAERLAARFAEHGRDHWAALAETADACLSPVLDFLEAARHPHNLANRLYRTEPFPQPGTLLDFISGS